MAETHTIGIQMTQKELTKTFRMIWNWKKTFGLHGVYDSVVMVKWKIGQRNVMKKKWMRNVEVGSPWTVVKTTPTPPGNIGHWATTEPGFVTFFSTTVSGISSMLICHQFNPGLLAGVTLSVHSSFYCPFWTDKKWDFHDCMELLESNLMILTT